MAHESISILTGIVLDEETELGLDELARACGAEREWVLELVAEGVITPVGEERSEWHFQGRSLARARVARRLARDLEVNLSGIALALDLLDEIEALRARLRALDE
ncbi:MAG: chaperone modulator CbpM [Gammaproteobacteria bacterium]